MKIFLRQSAHLLFLIAISSVSFFAVHMFLVRGESVSSGVLRALAMGVAMGTMVYFRLKSKNDRAADAKGKLTAPQSGPIAPQ